VHCNDGLISSFRNGKHTHTFTAIRDGLATPALEAAEFGFALSLLARSHITLIISDITFLPQMFVLVGVQHSVAVERLPSSERELQRLIAEAALEDVEDSVEENETSEWVKRKKESKGKSSTRKAYTRDDVLQDSLDMKVVSECNAEMGAERQTS
jgi:hypothetical protein